jgi:hypothetical protein
VKIADGDFFVYILLFAGVVRFGLVMTKFLQIVIDRCSNAEKF